MQSLRGSQKLQDVTEAGNAGMQTGVAGQLELNNQNLKIAVAQIKPLATRLDENVKSIKEYIDKAAAAGAGLVIFPELSIPGYLVLDLANDLEFVKANIKALKEVVEYTRGKNITVITGFIDYQEPQAGEAKYKFYNSAAVITKGRIIDVIDKTLLPDYDIFWEHRNFKSADERRTVNIAGHKVGIQICEDLWDKDYAVKVSDELKHQGAEFIVNLSASPFNAGKYLTRQELVQASAKKQNLPLIYTNMVGVQDGYEGEVVFDGRSMVCLPDGKVAGLAKAFEEDLLIVDLNQPKEVLLPEWAPVEEIYHALVLGIKEYCARSGFKRVYIGLSGGIDSAVTAALAVAALGPENVIGVTMPMQGITSSETLDDAIKLAAHLGIQCKVRPIGEMYQAWLKQANQEHEDLQRLTRQNQQARLRGQILMECVNEDRQALVISTGNKTEMALGYMTLYGDMCGGLADLGDVSKLMVYELAEFVNNVNEKELIPYTTIERTPSAELEPGQTDKDNLPADYPVLSPLVDEIVKKEKSREELYQLYGREVVDKTLKLVSIAEYKRRQAPPSIRVTSKSFGAGRRMPLDSKYY